MKNLIHFNVNIALKIFLLFGFAAFFLISIFTGLISLYVHPRIIPYMIFASVAMIIIAFLLFRDLFKPEQKETNSLPLLFFIVPLFMAFAFPAESFNSSTATIGEVQLSSEESISGNTVDPTQESQETDMATENSALDTDDTAEIKESDTNIPLQNGVLIIDSSNFYECLGNIYTDLDKYKGTRVEVVGFVFKEDENFAENEFVPARLMMVCCAADMQPVGLLCQYDQTFQLEADSWVKVSGIIEETEFDGYTVPCIIAQNVESAEEPDESYIYPY